MKVVFVELTVFANVLPLASGYMEAYCRKDPALAGTVTFDKISMPISAPYDDILNVIENSDGHVYAFSCYVWNTGRVRRLVDALSTSRPNAYIILGGPQVMHQGTRYLQPERENVFLCNGEGERTFYYFIRTLLTGSRDFANIKNLSFYCGRELITTAPEPRIADLSDLPSPFLEGIFESYKYTWMAFETNRGCPFKCNYCYWGAAIGKKVYKFDAERLQREIEWITQSGCVYLFIADANWGMLQRDVVLSHQLAESQKRNGAPMSVYFCGSKNTPERVAEITKIFHDAGMITTQSVALQTISQEALASVNRENVKTSAYTALQSELNRQGISSFVEMIWPLPGETLGSFQNGLAKLCELDVDAIVVYPLILMNNVELSERRIELGLGTIIDPDPDSEAEFVVRTAQVSENLYQEGHRYAYAVTGLYTLRGLWCLSRYLNSHGILSFADLFRSFVDFCRTRPSHPYTAFCENSIATTEFARFQNIGSLLHRILHTERGQFDGLLMQFVERQKFFAEPAAQFLFEVDLVNRPYVYSNTRIASGPAQFAQLQLIEVRSDSCTIDVPREHIALFREYMGLPTGEGQATRFDVRYRGAQLPFMPSKSLEEHYSYCQDMLHRIRVLLPIWQECGFSISHMEATMTSAIPWDDFSW